MNDSYKDFLKLLIPIVAVVISYFLGLAASKSSYKKSIKK